MWTKLYDKQLREHDVKEAQKKTRTAEEQAVFAAELDAALQPFADANHTTRALGLPLIEHEIRSTVMRDVRRFVPTALAVLLVVLFVTFRRTPRLVVYILLHQMLGIALLPVLLAELGLVLDTGLLMPVLITLVAATTLVSGGFYLVIWGRHIVSLEETNT